MLVATEAQFTRKVSIGSQLPGSCGDDTVSLPAAMAETGMIAALASAAAAKAVRRPLLIFIIVLLLFKNSKCSCTSRHKVAGRDLLPGIKHRFIADCPNRARNVSFDGRKLLPLARIGDRH